MGVVWYGLALPLLATLEQCRSERCYSVTFKLKVAMYSIISIHCSWVVQILSMASFCGWFWLNSEFHMQGHQMVGAVEGSTASTGCLFLWRHSRCFCQVTWLYTDGAPAESRFGMDRGRVKLAFFASRKGRPLSDAQKWFNRLAAEHMPDLGAFVSL